MRCLLSGEAPSTQLEQRYMHHDGHPVWIAVSVSLVRDLQSTPLYFVCQMEDITERRASGAALAHQAIHDPLTGLPNRTLFVERLERELARAAVNHERVAVLFLDLDRFKVVNDSLGHSAGRPAAGRGRRPAQRRDAPVRHRGPVRRRRVHGAVPQRA